MTRNLCDLTVTEASCTLWRLHYFNTFYDLDHVPMRTENDNGRRRNATSVGGNPSLDEDELLGNCVLFHEVLD
jgi:hypothetical protein